MGGSEGGVEMEGRRQPEDRSGRPWRFYSEESENC